MPGTPVSKLVKQTEENTEESRPLLQDSSGNSTGGHESVSIN